MNFTNKLKNTFLLCLILCIIFSAIIYKAPNLVKLKRLFEEKSSSFYPKTRIKTNSISPKNSKTHQISPKIPLKSSSIYPKNHQISQRIPKIPLKSSSKNSTILTKPKNSSVSTCQIKKLLTSETNFETGNVMCLYAHLKYIQLKHKSQVRNISRILNLGIF